MLTVVLFHPELMCVARLISFSHEQMRAEKAEKEAVALAQLQTMEDEEIHSSGPEIVQPTPDVQ